MAAASKNLHLQSLLAGVHTSLAGCPLPALTALEPACTMHYSLDEGGKALARSCGPNHCIYIQAAIRTLATGTLQALQSPPSEGGSISLGAAKKSKQAHGACEYSQ